MHHRETPSIAIDQLRIDLERLSSQILSLSAQLQQPIPSPEPDITILPPTPPSSPSHNRFSLLNLIPGKSKKRSYSLRRNGRGKGKYQNIDDELPLINHDPDQSRRDSVHSDETLVDPSPPFERMGAEELLKELSGPISALQRIGNSLSASNRKNEHDDLINLFRRSCNKLIKSLESLSIPSSSSGSSELDFNPDKSVEYDLEMRNLMISALIKKVHNELDRLPTFTSPFQDYQKLNRQSSSGSIAALPSRNPFIVHSTSLSSSKYPHDDALSLQSSPCSTSTLNVPALSIKYDSDTESEVLLSPTPSQVGGRRQSKPIKIESLNETQDDDRKSFSSFSSKSQMTSSSSNSSWAQNIIRLGSYQASLLFSNSPIAVRKLNGENRKGCRL